ncbi:MAG: hypothetical protein ACRDH5_18245, partial [bacterium]
AGTGGQVEPYTLLGQRWLPNGAEAAANRFAVALVNLSAATLDVARMGLGTSSVIDATVQTEGPTTLRLTGSWPPTVSVEGATSYAVNGNTLELTFTAGTFNVTIRP